MTKLPSLHDDYLVSYEVRCEARQITLVAKRAPPKAETRQCTVVFDGVEGYHLENDAFGNIVFSLEETSLQGLLSQYGAKIAESHRLTGAPGPWAADLSSARQALAAKGMRAFILESSYGLCGWVLAKDVSATWN